MPAMPSGGVTIHQAAGVGYQRALGMPNPPPTTHEGVQERMASSSIIATLGTAEQDRVRAEVDAVLRSHARTRDGDCIELPCTTDVYWTHRV